MIMIIQSLFEIIIIMLLGITLFMMGCMGLYWIAEIITGLFDKEK